MDKVPPTNSNISSVNVSEYETIALFKDGADKFISACAELAIECKAPYFAEYALQVEQMKVLGEKLCNMRGMKRIEQLMAVNAKVESKKRVIDAKTQNNGIIMP